MSDATRLAAMEAVAEAADELDRLFISGCPYLSQARNKMHLAIRALRAASAPQPAGCISAAPTGCVSDSECAAAGRCLERPALPAQPKPAVKVVTLAVWEDKADGDVQFARIGGKMDGYRLQYRNWERLGTVTLPITVEPGA